MCLWLYVGSLSVFFCIKLHKIQRTVKATILISTSLLKNKFECFSWGCWIPICMREIVTEFHCFKSLPSANIIFTGNQWASTIIFTYHTKIVHDGFQREDRRVKQSYNYWFKYRERIFSWFCFIVKIWCSNISKPDSWIFKWFEYSFKIAYLFVYVSTGELFSFFCLIYKMLKHVFLSHL